MRHMSRAGLISYEDIRDWVSFIPGRDLTITFTRTRTAGGHGKSEGTPATNYAHDALKLPSTPFSVSEGDPTHELYHQPDAAPTLSSLPVSQETGHCSATLATYSCDINRVLRPYTTTQYRREIVAINRRYVLVGMSRRARLFQHGWMVSFVQHNAIALEQINRILQQVGEELDDLEVQKTEIQIEIDSTQAEELEKSIEESYRGKSDVQEAKSAQATASIV